MLTYQTDSLVEWLTLPSLSQTAALLFFFERSVRPPRPPRSIVPWWGYGNAQRLRCFSQREQVGDPHRRRFTLCSCETITIMGYRAERSWGNARWAIGPRQREKELERPTTDICCIIEETFVAREWILIIKPTHYIATRLSMLIQLLHTYFYRDIILIRPMKRWKRLKLKRESVIILN